MVAAPSPELVAAYRATRYMAGDGGTFATIGTASAAMDALLDAHGAAWGVFITAWNPGSSPRDAAANRADHARMVDALAGTRHLPHVGVGEGGWREEGFFVLDLPETVAVALARRFGQVAIVIARREEAARLILTGIPPASPGTAP
jgi:hypothetical protein